MLDPVCRKTIDPQVAYAAIPYKDNVYYLCCPLCATAFEIEPDKYVDEARLIDPNQTNGKEEHRPSSLIYTVTVTSGFAR